MAIDFPNSPTSNQVFTSGNLSWRWNSSLSVWESYNLPITIPEAAPTTPGSVYGKTPNDESKNAAFGYNALAVTNQGSVTDGGANTAIGFSSLPLNTMGFGNVSVGAYTMQSNIAGSNNVSIGASSLANNLYGIKNTAIGNDALYRNINGNRNVAIGYQAGLDELGSDKLYIANSNTTTPLIYGEFDNTYLKINGTLEANAVAGATNTTAAYGVGYMGIPQVSAVSGVTLSAAYAGRHIYTTTTGQTHTIPSNASVPLPIGTTIIFINPAAVTTTIAIASDLLIQAGTGTTGSRTLAPYGMATIIKISATSWMISGNGIS